MVGWPLFSPSKEKTLCGWPETTETFAVSSLKFFLIMISSSLIFACVFEWDRYQIIMGTRGAALCAFDKVLLFWLLVAKSLAWFLPVLPVVAILTLLRLRRTATVALIAAWICIFYLMAADLISVGFMGYHFWDYFPHIRDIYDSPDQKIWQWAGERLSTEALLILGFFVVLGPIWFFGVSRATGLFANRLQRVAQPTAVGTLIAALLLTMVGVVPALEYFQDRNILDRIYEALPFTPGMRKSCEGVIEHLTHPLGKPHHPPTTASLASIGHPLKHRRTPGSVPGEKAAGSAYESAAPVFSLGERIRWQNPLRATEMKPGNAGASSVEEFGPRELQVRPAHSGDAMGGTHEPVVRRCDELAAAKIAHDATNPAPADLSAFVQKPGLPNIILVIFESFRPAALSPSLMKKLDAWSNQGLRLDRHYSGSNCSHLGLFSLFYGRSPLGYHQTLDRKVPSQLLESLHRSGYNITFLTSGEVKGFRRLHEFISDRSCDEVITEGDFVLNGMKDWPDSDRRKLAHVRNIVTSGRDRPQFVFFYLVSSHFRYAFPPEFDIFKEKPSFWQFLNARDQIQNHLNRYANALLFLEYELMNLLKSIDLERNIVIITGDHGESMGEDGVFTHASRMSEAQLRVPCVMVGGGIKPRVINTATAHMDILPTLLHALSGKPAAVRNILGRDLIADQAPADEVFLTPANGPEWEGLLMIRGKDRLIFRTSTADAENTQAEFAGLIDECGHLEWKVGQPLPARHSVQLNQ